MNESRSEMRGCCLWVWLLAGLGALDGPAVFATPDHNQHQGMMHAAATDAHAAHRASMAATHYSIGTTTVLVPDVTLLDAEGTAVELDDVLAADSPIALNFIFTTCTTICPVMTATFAQMRNVLGDMAEDLAMVSISIDPEYDRPTVLKAYAEQFGAGPGWRFLTGDSLDIERVLRSFDVYAGSKMNHRPVTLLHEPGAQEWIRIEGLASGESLAEEVTARLLD